MKKFLAILLTLTLTFCMSNAVFAVENENTIPEDATRHTVELSLAPGENIIPVNGSDSATPYIWGDPSMSLIDNHTAYTSEFYVSDKYFAFEMEGHLINGTFTDDVYNVGLEYVGGSVIASLSGYADGSLYKMDWITINVDGNYRFKVTNGSDYYLTVYLTYYSWN